jgi:hypothetical protein
MPVCAFNAGRCIHAEMRECFSIHPTRANIFGVHHHTAGPDFRKIAPSAMPEDTKPSPLGFFLLVFALSLPSG